MKEKLIKTVIKLKIVTTAKPENALFTISTLVTLNTVGTFRKKYKKDKNHL